MGGGGATRVGGWVLRGREGGAWGGTGRVRGYIYWPVLFLVKMEDPFSLDIHCFVVVFSDNACICIYNRPE